MNEKILIVEDEMIVATDLRILLEKNGYQVIGIARSFEKAVELAEREKPDMVLLDIFLTGTLTGIDVAKKLKEKDTAFIYISANANEEVLSMAKTTEPYGFIVKPFREKDLLVTLEIARYRHEHSVESMYRKEAELQEQLESIFAASTSWEQKLLKIGTAIQPYIPFDYLAAGFNDMGLFSLKNRSFLRIGFNEYQSIGAKELLTITGMSTDELIAVTPVEPGAITPRIYNDDAFTYACKQSRLKKIFADTFHLNAHLAMPLLLPGMKPFNLLFFSRSPEAYSTKHIHLLNHLRYTLTTGIEKIIDNKNANYTQLTVNTAGAEDKRREASCFEKIIGNSYLLLNLFDLVAQVAPMDTSVLILGESGTGKERIADCIHELSPRKNKPLIKINCATLPATLIESELFGHEKGSFTNALEKRIGKFEQADGGTIFLDEIGEMPLDLQVKLLRVLQEKEIERIGGRSPIKIDVRIIAATNRNLEREVAGGRFRLDLYYRLNVFPITLPPLRDRKEDIPLLAAHFINRYSRKAAKKITGVSEKVAKTLATYNWPGNIRELEHLIERNVLMAKGNVIEEISLPTMYRTDITVSSDELPTKSIHENEREHILSILKKCRGKIYGPGGAAELLNIPPTTLSSKMKKLGIKREFTD
ncbi:MAG: sigma 54-interacting response regulator [Ginsengibacter sp.]